MVKNRLEIPVEPTPCQSIEVLGVEVVVKREDLNHPVIQGNKLRKLKYNIQPAVQQHQTVVTFGGAYSNHLLATAFACQQAGLQSLGVVRGDELKENPSIWSETLYQCQQYGMQLLFVSRSEYRLKARSVSVQQALQQIGAYLLIPEGGSNQLAVQGMAELVEEMTHQIPAPSHLICPVGTGGTLAGLIAGVSQSEWSCQVLGVAVLKGLQGVKDDINQWLTDVNKVVDWSVYHQYHCGGYAKKTPSLERFAVAFSQKHGFELDKIYNAKAFFALAQMIKQGAITSKHRPLIVHTGGLQGGVF